MRVLFWSEVFWPHIGGAQIFAARLLPSLEQRGHRFIVVTRQDNLTIPSDLSFEGIPVRRFPFALAMERADVDQIAELRHHVAELKRTFAPDLVHVNSFGPSVWFHLDTLSAHPTPTLLTIHGERYATSGQSGTILERMLREADWITAPSASTLAFVRQLVPEVADRSSFIHNSVEVPPVAPDPLPFSPPQLLCLGRLDRSKGFDLAIAALPAVVDRFPGIRLVIVGNGQEREALEEQAAELRVASTVSFLEWVTPRRVFEILNKATVVLMPSRREGLPLVAIEAALMARPIIAANVGGLPEIVEDHLTGVLIPPEDSASLAKAVSFLLERPSMARRLGETARNCVTEAFRFETHIDAYATLYRKMQSRQRQIH